MAPNRCPHCQAEVAAGAAFCGACGASLASGHAGSQVQSPSLFELPVSKRARWVRVAVVLTLDAVLAGAGVAMIGSYLEARAEAARPPGAQAAVDAAAPAPKGEVAAAPGRVVRPGNEKPPVSRPPADSSPAPVTPRPPSSPAPRPPSGGGASTTRPPASEAPGTDDPGAVLGGISRRPDGGLPPTSSPRPTPDAAVLPTTPPPLPAAEPDAAVAEPPPPPPDPGASDSEQALASGVQRTIESHMGQVRRCWENIAKSSADSNLPEGTVEVQFAVLPSGSASAVQVVQNGTGSPQLGDCVIALVNSWTFPTHEGEPVVFVWPFFFRASR